MTYTDQNSAGAMKISFYPGMQISDTAVGGESNELPRAYEAFVRDFFVPISRESLFPAMKFYRLKSQWEAETAFLSSLSDIAMHPAYQQIIGMGPTAIPLILSEMKIKRGHWFWALKSITGDDPVASSDKGNIKKMTQIWLRWGREQGYIR